MLNLHVCDIKLVLIILLLGIIGIFPQYKAAASNSVPVRVVNNLSDNIRFSCPSQCTLRSAIETVDPGGTVQFDSNLNGEIKLTSGAILIEKDIIISGNGRSITVISGGRGDDDPEISTRMFHVKYPAKVSFKDLTIRRGGTSLQSGGAIYNRRWRNYNREK